MNARIIALVVAGLDTLALVLAAIALFASGSDPATSGLDSAAGAAVVGLYAVTALPALLLAYFRRAPRTALMLALAFPAVFAALFIAVVIAYAW
jgi:hypothetical protein